MKLIRAYTADLEDRGPALVLELAGNPPASIDTEHKASVIAAGVAILYVLDVDDELVGFEDVEVQLYADDPASRILIEATKYTAATRDPRVLDLAREFLRSTDNGSFRPGVQVYPVTLTA